MPSHDSTDLLLKVYDEQWKAYVDIESFDALMDSSKLECVEVNSKRMKESPGITPSLTSARSSSK